MLRLVFAAGVMAAALMPTAAMAQPYYEPPTPYPDQQQKSPSADDYSRDSADNDQDADQDADRSSSQDGDYQHEHFTGRVGASWRDGDGRHCRWREVARTESDGYAAYKWVTVCRN